MNDEDKNEIVNIGDDDQNTTLPTLREWLSHLVGFEVPALSPLPRTLKNLDKAVGTIVLAAGSNLAEKIDHRRLLSKLKHEEIRREFRNGEEQRKELNREAIMINAAEEMAKEPPKEDAKADIDDDWLNLFARVSEDKSTAELQQLFGRILSGEISRPGSFSLRTIQFLATLSKSEAQAIADFMSYEIIGVIAFRQHLDDHPDVGLRLRMQEQGLISGNPNKIGGLMKKFTIKPGVATIPAANMALAVQNTTDREIVARAGAGNLNRVISGVSA